MFFYGNAEIAELIEAHNCREDQSKAEAAEYLQGIGNCVREVANVLPERDKCLGQLNKVESDIRALEEEQAEEEFPNSEDERKEEHADPRYLRLQKLLLKERREKLQERREKLKERLDKLKERLDKLKERKMHFETQRNSKLEIANLSCKQAQILYEVLLRSGLDGVSGSTKRAALFLKYCGRKDLFDLASELSADTIGAVKRTARIQSGIAERYFSSISPGGSSVRER